MGRELQKILNVNVKIIPLAVGSLGATPKQFGNRLKQIGITVGTVLPVDCGSISTVFSSIVLLCVSPIIIRTIIV